MALKISEEAIQEHGGVETLGPMVHNSQVVANLSKLGVMVVENPEYVQGSIVVYTRVDKRSDDLMVFSLEL